MSVANLCSNRSSTVRSLSRAMKFLDHVSPRISKSPYEHGYTQMLSLVIHFAPGDSGGFIEGIHLSLVLIFYGAGISS